MKILFDEDVPRDLTRYFPAGFQISIAQLLGWQSTPNGELLRLASSEAFDALITMDKNMQRQRRQQPLPMPVFVLCAPHQRDYDYLGDLVTSYIVPALEQGAEQRFHLLGHGFANPDYHKA